VEARLEQLRRQAAALLGREINLGSPQQLAQVQGLGFRV
jgi:hypothetical protein